VKKGKSFLLREILTEDQDFLFEMLYLAIFVPPGTPTPDRSILGIPEIRRYAESWGKPGDFGYIAVDQDSGIRLGAVWLRYFNSRQHGYGYISDDIPEMSIAVLPEKRGIGIGSALLDGLRRYAEGRMDAVSLSVQPENPAVRLYERFGFVHYSKSGDSIIMCLDTRKATTGPAEYSIHTLDGTDIDMMKELLLVFGEAFEEPHTYHTKIPDESYLKALLEKDYFLAVTAESEGKIIGGLAAYVLEKFEQNRKEIYIYDLAVLEGYRRRKVATKIIRHLQRIAGEIGTYVIFVQADYGDEPAVRLYESLGIREQVLHFDIPVHD